MPVVEVVVVVKFTKFSVYFIINPYLLKESSEENVTSTLSADEVYIVGESSALVRAEQSVNSTWFSHT